MLRRLAGAAIAAAIATAAYADRPVAVTVAVGGGHFTPVYQTQTPDPGDGWGMRNMPQSQPVEAAPSRLDSLAGPRRADEMQAGYLWEQGLSKAVLGFSQLDMGPRSTTRALGAPDLLRPTKEDAPGVLGLGLVIRTR